MNDHAAARPPRGALALYAGSPLASACTCTALVERPFTQSRLHCRGSGRILEIGCGHGLFRRLRRMSERERTSWASISTRARSTTRRQRPPGPRPRGMRRLERQGGRIRRAPSRLRSPSPARCPPALGRGRQSSTCSTCWPAIGAAPTAAEAVAELAPGGWLVVKEMGTHPAGKCRWNTCRRPSPSACSESPRVIVRLRGPGRDGGLAPRSRPDNDRPASGPRPAAPSPPPVDDGRAFTETSCRRMASSDGRSPSPGLDVATT